MITTDDPDEFLAFQSSTSQVIGYHSSTHSACIKIEKVGFLPSKVLPLEDHDRLLKMAEAYQIQSFDLQNWLSMRSVTFTRHPVEALKHIQQGSAGGQGLKNVMTIIEALPPELSQEDQTFIGYLGEKIQAFRADQPVTYIVDLTGLGERLDPDKLQPFYYYRWNPKEELPKESEIGPDRILMKLIHKNDAV